MNFDTIDTKARSYCLWLFALFLAIFHTISAVWGMPNTLAFRYIHLTGMLVIVFMKSPLKTPRSLKYLRLIDFVFAATAVGVLMYILSDLRAFANREGACTPTDVLLGTFFLIIVIEATRRIAGIIMVILAMFLALQNVFALYMPGIFRTAPVTYTRLIDFLFMRTTGIIGSALTCMCNYVIFFMIFATILEATGAGQFFIDLALAIAGKKRGGPAKAAVISSALFGSLSGSAIANVASTGSITIPLMKKTGYDSAFSGAVEAVASTGGQIMPPMMGAAAFIMAENLGMQYISLALAALIPALMYFISVYFMVDLRAVKTSLVGADPNSIPSLSATLKRGWVYLLPLVVIVGMLVAGRSALSSAVWSTALLIIISMISPNVNMDGKKMVKSICAGVIDTASVSATAATAGIIVGGIMISGIGLKLTQMIIALSQGILPIALVFTAIVSIILGMGMTTTAVYVTVATIVAPSLVKLGVPNISAHMFCFYFGCICTITPPVALAAYTAAGISGASPSKTGWTSFIVGIAAYIVPFLFVYKPELLLQGSLFTTFSTTMLTLIAIYSTAALVQRCIKTDINMIESLILLSVVILAFYPNVVADILSVSLFAAVLVIHYIRNKKLVKV